MNKAAQKLREILDKQPLGAYNACATSIGTDAAQLSKWLVDKHRPSLASRVRISELYGIGILEWDEEVREGAAGDAA